MSNTASTVLAIVVLIIILGCFVAWGISGFQQIKIMQVGFAPTAFGTTPPGHEWHALPGMRIELGATGFVVTLDTRVPVPQQYRLHDPEGRYVGCSHDLDTVKGCAERLAREREAFAAFGAEAAAEALRRAAVDQPPRKP